MARPFAILGLIGLYLAGHFLLRLTLSPSLGMDDAEQTLFAQQWAFGYRFRQPPLFTWLLMPVTWVTGPSILAIGIVRYGLLALTYVFIYMTARHCLRDPRMAGLVVLSFASIYVFAYYAHHDLTHTTALGAMIGLSFHAMVRLAKAPTLPAYLLVGLAFGLGMLAKWNFAMLAIGLPLTCLILPAHRHLILTWKSLIAISVMVAVTAPTALWMLEHGQSIQGVSSDILSAGNQAHRLTGMLKGGGDLLTAIALFPLPFLPIFLLLFTRNLHAGLTAPEISSAARSTLPPSFFGWLTLIVLGLHVPLIPTFGAIDFTERWLHPAFMSLPIFLFGLLERGHPTGRRITVYLGVMAILVAATAGGRLYRYAEGADACGRCREFAPFASLAEDLRNTGFTSGTIVADGMHIGGNLKMLFAESRVIDPAFPRALWPEQQIDVADTDGACLLIWRDGDGVEGLGHNAVRNYATIKLGLKAGSPAEAGRIEANLIGSPTRRYALGFELYRENVGGCR